VYGERFVDVVVGLLRDSEMWEHWQERAAEFCAENDWQQRIPDWEALVPTKASKKVAVPVFSALNTTTSSAGNVTVTSWPT